MQEKDLLARGDDKKMMFVNRCVNTKKNYF